MIRTNPCTVAAAFAALLATPLVAAESKVADAQASRTAPGTYRLRWAGVAAGAPVDVYVADRPNAPKKELRLVVDNDTDGEATVSSKLSGRPYFYVTVAKGAGVWTAERVLPLEGGHNFRDLGGYATADGKRVKWGKVFRSGTMSGLTLADYGYLSNLGIKVVCDFRATDERKAEPNKWQQVQKVAYWTRDYDMGFGELGKLFSTGGTPTPDAVRAIMTEGYRKTPYEQADGYREMFRRLAAGEIPLAFNCSAGKDRTGVAAALILSALGVPRETIVADYALSDKVVDFRRATTRGDASNNPHAFLAKLPPDVVAPLMKSDADYIRAMFAEVERRHGSVERYLTDVLGLNARDLQAIRRQLLE